MASEQYLLYEYVMYDPVIISNYHSLSFFTGSGNLSRILL